jgi:predicted ester cyclase
MPYEQNLACFNRFVEEGLNQHKVLEIGDEICNPDLILEAPGVPTADGHKAGYDIFKVFASSFVGAFPDVVCTLKYSIGEGETIAFDIDYKGTHKKEFGGIPATNKYIEGGELWYVEFKGGKMQSIRICEYGTPLRDLLLG